MSVTECVGERESGVIAAGQVALGETPVTGPVAGLLRLVSPGSQVYAAPYLCVLCVPCLVPLSHAQLWADGVVVGD